MEPIRILHVFGRLDRGGAESFIMNVYREIDRSKVQFDFMIHTNDKCDFTDEVISMGGRIFNVPRFTGINILEYTNAWNCFFKNYHNFACIHAHMTSTAAIFLPIAKKFNIARVTHSHNTTYGNTNHAIVKSFFQYFVRFLDSYKFACSTEAATWLYGEKKASSGNVKMIHNCVNADLLKFDENVRCKKRKELLVEDKIVILHIGRFENQKNHSFLIEIFSEINKQNKNSVLLLVGRGELEDSIKNQVSHLGLDESVKFLGVRKDVSEILQAADIFLFPSLFEGLPVVIVEAQASGLPCVISETVSRETKITNLVTFIKLSQPPTEWAKVTLDTINDIQRVDVSNQIIEKGFDVDTVTKWLQNSYLEDCK